MASGTANTTGVPSPPPPPPSLSSESERLIYRQLKQTSTHVKVVDLVSALMVLAIGVLGYLLTVAVVDSWVFDLGLGGRLLALAGLLGGSVWYLIVAVLPLIVRQINPAYSAKTIEQSQPSLKNSLINFLMLRSHRPGVREVVYQAVQQKAASDLSRISTDTAVDRSRLIRIGYVLAGVLVICALYKILSPADPFQSIGRAVAPFADLARPARVQIEEVRPGSSALFLGQTVEVTAILHGLTSSDRVDLQYTTADGQTIDRRIVMQQAEGQRRHRCMLPAGDKGLQQDLMYRVVARDARHKNRVLAESEDFHLTVVPEPTITVEQVDYRYPPYTELPSRNVSRQGDIQALEGTTVTVRARANQPIETAYIEFDPRSDDDVDRSGVGTTARGETLVMQHDGDRAWCSFVLGLDADRPTPRHASYQVRFINDDGVTNHRPIRYRIDVTPDLSPDVEILSPDDDYVEVPLNARRSIEIRALDPDFALTRITLKAEVDERRIVDEPLLEALKGRRGQVVVDYEFVPSALGLVVGDKVNYWAEAEDNRTAPATDTAAPNVAQTRRYTIAIVEPEVGRAARRDDPEPPADPRNSQPPQDDPSPRSNAPQDDTQGGSDSPNGANQQGAEGAGGSQPSDPQTGEGQSGQEGGSGQPSQDNGGGGSQGQGGGSDGAGSRQGGQSTSGQSAGDGAAGDGSSTGRRDPLHDGEVFEQALDHRQQQQGDSGDGQSGAQGGAPNGQTGGSDDGSGDGSSGGNPTNQNQQGQDSGGQGDASDAPPSGGANQQGANQQGANGDSSTGHRQPMTGGGDGAASQPSGNQQPSGDGQSAGASSGGDSRQGAGQQGGGQDSPSAGGDSSGENQTTGEQNNSSGGEGGRPQGGAPTSNDSGGGGQTPNQDQQQGAGQGQSGQSGGSQQDQNEGGSAGSQGNNQGGPKRTASGGSRPQQGAGQSPSQSNRPSDSQGGQGGDRSGGGQQGAGQSASGQPGSDSPGSGSASDDGAGSANQRGQGDVSQQPGGSQPSDGTTGEPSTGRGNGSTGQSSPDGDVQGEGPPQFDSSGQSTGGGGASADRRRGATGRENGRPQGGSGDPSQAAPGAAGDAEAPPGDEVDLEHARQATDLALEHLRDHQDDPELLERLQMSPDELARFLDRWDRMKQAARGDDARARRELDQSLRSLGLRPPRDVRSDGGGLGDEFHDQRDDGLRSRPPSAYEELFRAFKKSAGRTDATEP